MFAEYSKLAKAKGYVLYDIWELRRNLWLISLEQVLVERI